MFLYIQGVPGEVNHSVTLDIATTFTHMCDNLPNLTVQGAKNINYERCNELFLHFV